MEFAVDGRTLTVRVRSSQRARYASVSVPALDVVEVVLPRRVAQRHVGAILAEKEAWIRRRLARLEGIEARAAERAEAPSEPATKRRERVSGVSGS